MAERSKNRPLERRERRRLARLAGELMRSRISWISGDTFGLPCCGTKFPSVAATWLGGADVYWGLHPIQPFYQSRLKIATSPGQGDI